MSNVLDLQGLPEAKKTMSAQVIAGGNCISVLSVVNGAAEVTAPDEHAVPAQVHPLGNCISVLSVVGGND